MDKAGRIYSIYHWDGSSYIEGHYEFCEVPYTHCEPIMIDLIPEALRADYVVDKDAKLSMRPDDGSEEVGVDMNDRDVLGQVREQPWYLVKTGVKGASGFVRATDIAIRKSPGSSTVSPEPAAPPPIPPSTSPGPAPGTAITQPVDIPGEK
jgi:hypothetical protein